MRPPRRHRCRPGTFFSYCLCHLILVPGGYGRRLSYRFGSYRFDPAGLPEPPPLRQRVVMRDASRLTKFTISNGSRQAFRKGRRSLHRSCSRLCPIARLTARDLALPAAKNKSSFCSAPRSLPPQVASLRDTSPRNEAGHHLDSRGARYRYRDCEVAACAEPEALIFEQ